MTHTGDQPELLMCIVSFSAPIILGMDGPQISVSMMPIVLSGFSANACASRLVNVDSGTPRVSQMPVGLGNGLHWAGRTANTSFATQDQYPMLHARQAL